MTDIIKQVMMALLSSLAFGIIFNLHGCRLVLAGIGGMLGWIAYLIFYHFTAQEVTSYMLATVVTTLYAQSLARIVKCPATLFLVPTVVPILPGGYLYYTMLYACEGNWSGFLSKGVLTLSTAGAIAVGMLVGSSLYTGVLKIRRTVKNSECLPK